MKKYTLILLVYISLSAKSQVVNRFRDSTWFAKSVRFDSAIYLIKGASNGKVLTSDAYGRATWQSASGGVSQSALDDSINSVRSIRKVDTLYKNLDSIIYKINGIRYAIKDSSGGLTDSTIFATKNYVNSLNGSNATITSLNDSITSVRNIRKVDTLYRNLDSIIYKINSIRYAIKDSTGADLYALITGGNNTLYVSKQGNNATGTKGNRALPYLTIQAAINASTAGDVVLVMEGTYIENVALKDSVKLVAETWGGVTIQHAGTSNTWAISSPTTTVLGIGAYYDIFIWGFRITNPTSEATIKIQAQRLNVVLAYLEAKSKDATYISKIYLYASSTSSGFVEIDVVDVKAISSSVAQFGFDGAVGTEIASVYALPTCHIKVLNFTEVTTIPLDYIGWQNWNWKVDVVNSNTINAGGIFGEIYHQNCNGHVGIYRSIRTGSQGNDHLVFYMPEGTQQLTIDYFYSAGQERVITDAGNSVINIGQMYTDGLIFSTVPAGKTQIINADKIRRINSKATSIFYIFPTGAGSKVKLNCNYCESNGSGKGTIYTFNNSNVAMDIYLSGEFYNSNATNSLVIQDDATATIKYKINGSAILRNNQSAGTKAYGSLTNARSLYINGGLGVTQTNSGTAPTVVTGAISIDTGY